MSKYVNLNRKKTGECPIRYKRYKNKLSVEGFIVIKIC